MANPSALKIAVFFAVFHLMIMVTNYIEIAPGYYFDTGEIEPFQEYYDPLNGLANDVQNIQTLINNLKSNQTGDVVSIDVCWNFGVNYCYTLSQDVTANALGFTYGPFVLLINMIIAILTSNLSIVLNIFASIILLIVIITVGAIPFWTMLFSFVDPTLGIILGLAFGSIQMLYITIAIFRFISAMLAGISRFL
jgi:hypothetical protein